MLALKRVFIIETLATVFLNGVLASTDLDASVAGGTTADFIDTTGALDGGLIKGAQNNDTLDFDLSGGNITNSVINGNDGFDALNFFNSFDPVRSSITETNIFGGMLDDALIFEDVVVGSGTRVRGNAGEDFIQVSDADGAIVNGNGDEDELVLGIFEEYGGFKNSQAFGGQGEDGIFIYTADSSTIKGNDGNDVIYFAGDDSINLLVNGNDGIDFIGADGDSRISDSVIRGGAGEDFINLSNAWTNDVALFGDAGDDFLEGGDGDDDITGGIGADLMIGTSNSEDSDDNFIFSTGDSFAATNKGEDQGGGFLTYGNGVDIIDAFDFVNGGGAGGDTVTYNGTTFDSSDFVDNTIGNASINDSGDFVIGSSGSAAGIYAVKGDFELDTGRFFSNDLGDEILFFDAGSVLNDDATVIGTSVEALIIGFDILT